MSRNKMILGILAAALVAVIAFWVFGSSNYDEHPQEDSEEQAEDGEEAEGSSEEGLVLLSSEQITAAKITVVGVANGGAGELVLPATIAARPDSIAIIDARASGVVRSLRKSLGENVRRGEAVATIESAEAASLAAARSAAQARFNQARAFFEREQGLFDQNVTARQDLEAAQANLSVARAELNRASAAASAAGVGRDGRSIAVTSPISGSVTAATATLGSFVNAGEELFRVVNPNGLQIEVAIPASDIGRIRPGDVATFDLPGGGSATAQVRAVTPSLDPENRTAIAVLPLPRALTGLQAGSFIEVRLQRSGETDPNRVAVPEDAVQTLDGQTVVFIRTKEGFKIQAIQTGDRSAGMVTILSGLEPGQTIASDNSFLLKSELKKDEAGDDD